MFLSQINNFETYTSKLSIQEAAFLHIIPDFNIDIIDSVNNLNIGLNNCQSIYIKTNNIKFANKTINPKIYFYKMKERRDIPASLVQSLPAKISTNKFIIVDHSIISQGIHQLLEASMPPKAILSLLFDKLKEEFTSLKQKFPNVAHTILFNLTLPESEGLYQVLSILKQYIPPSIKCFDNKILVSVNYGEQKTLFIPLASYDTKGNVDVLINNFSKINNALNNSVPIEVPVLEPVKSNSNEEALKNELTEKISKAIINSTEQSEQIYRASLELDKQKLTKALKNFQIKDPVVSNNIKTAIDQYLENKPGAKREDLEGLILKSIHFSLFGDGNIRDEYKADPSKLISKLSEMNTVSKDITYPEIVHMPQMVSPGDVISLHRVTGLGRHKYELSQNLDFAVRNLFQSLENRKINPIKVLKIKSELVDNNLDRIREYTITVKNLNGGLKEAYDLKLRIPALVNDYYFKLNGQNYILNNQMYLKPITKDKDSEARFLSHYNMVTLKVVNSKFNTSQINDILNYIRLKYYQNCKNIEIDQNTGNVTKLEFLDGVTIEPAALTPFKTPTKEIIFDETDYKIHDLTLDKYIDLHIPKNEYIFQELLLQIQKINPEEKLNRTSKSIPYIQIHAMGRQLPLILFLWQQIGLIEALTRYNINYEIAEKPTLKFPNIIELPISNNKHIFIYPETKRQELFVNGLTQLPKDFTISESGLSSRNSLDEFINSKYGNRTTFSFDLMMDNIIDPTTKDLLEFEDYPTNFIDIVNGPLLDKLLNDTPDHPADLKNLRLRQAEVLTNILYSEIAMAINKYNTDLTNGITDAKLYFHPDYVTAMLLGKHAHSESSETASGIMDFNVTFSPVDELIKASKVVKTGPGGVPSKRAFRKEHRAIHDSYIGTIASHSTSEYASVGIVNSLTLGASIANNYGGFGGKRPNRNEDNIDSLSIDEYLIPYCAHLDSGRMILARTHIAQKIPILKGELPIIDTGAEYLVHHLTSTKFVHTAKSTGKVLAVSPNEYITIQYDNGKVENLDIMSRYTATKRNSTIQISLDTLQVGDTFQKGQMISWSKSFNGDGLVIGRNVMLAIYNYRGYSFEDGYCISEKMSNNYVSENIIKVPIIIPLNTKVISIINEKNTPSTSETPLIEFQYLNSINDYIDNYELLSNDDEDDGEQENSTFLKGTNTLKRMSPGGDIIDIKIKLNSRNGIDPLLIDLWEQQKKNINRLEKTLTKYAESDEEKLTDNIDLTLLKVGGHKLKAKEFDGALIEYYIKNPTNLQVGNKLANRYGAKGVCSYIIPEKYTPKGEFTPEVDIFIQPAGVLGRKNTSILKELYTGKILYFLPNIVSEKLQNNEKLSDVKKLILEIYELLGDERCSESIVKKFETVTDTVLKQSLIHKAIRFNLTVPPFTSQSFDKIEKAAKILNIPLNERVFMPEIGEWTKDPVPVGVQYFSAMEQLSSDYESTRSSAGYVSATGQPTSGKNKLGGQALGELDIYNLLTYDCNNILKELLMARSDNMNDKRELIGNLREYGQSNIPKGGREGATNKLFNIFITGQGLFL